MSDTNKSVHLVLSAGGVRCLSYIGALKVLRQHGVEIKSISCCSAGSLLGALLAFGVDLDAMERFAVEKGFKQYVGEPAYPFWSEVFAMFRYPFARYKSTRMPQFFTDLVGADPLLSEAQIPYATVAIDIVNDRFVVFSSQTHPEMRVSEAVGIATAVPGMFAPVRRKSRVLVDAAVTTASPVWMVPAHGDDSPIVVLKPQSYEDFGYQRSIGAYLLEMFRASTESRDWYTFQSDPRVRVIEINYDNIAIDQFDLTAFQVERLIHNGSTAMENLLPFLWSEREVFTTTPALSEDDAGAQMASDLIGKYRALLGSKRNQIFISYSQQDREWLDRMLVILEPFRLRSGLQIWSDRSITTGEDVQSAMAEALRSTKVAVLFVTADYLADEALWKQQLSYFTEAAHKKELELIWVLVGKCLYEDTPLAGLKSANDPSQPLKALPPAEQEAALISIAKKIKVALV